MARAHLALVTGASRGIGAQVAARLAEAGAAVLVAARGEEDCARTAAALVAHGARAWPLPLDVADPSSIAGAVCRAAALAHEVGPVDWLVNNAGVAVSAPLLGVEQEELAERHMQVNYHGARRLVEAFLPGMRARGTGRIVNVASSAGLRGYAYVSAYCASKFALVGYTLAAARELAGSGVTINAVCPHYVASPMLDEAVARVVARTGRPADEVREFFRRENPSGRLVTVGAVAAAVRDVLLGGENGTLLELDGSDVPRLHRLQDGVQR